MKKRSLCLALCLVLVISLLPLNVSATTTLDSVSLKIDAPVAGKTASMTATAQSEGYFVYAIDWLDVTADRFLENGEIFVDGHIYRVGLWVEADSGYEFKHANSYTPSVRATVNGMTATAEKAYEYNAWAMVYVCYTFPAAELPHTHTPSDWRTTQVYHYKVCTTCGDFLESVDHTAGPAGTPNTDVVCSVCGYVMIPAPEHTHTPSDWRTTQPYHYKVCTTCGEFLEQNDHSGGVASCAAKGKCAVCGYAYLPETENHNPENKWTACAGLYHAHLCKDCGAHCDPQDHKAGPAATETDPQTCTVCGYIMAPAKGHTHSLTKVDAVPATCTKTGTIEHYTCAGCSELFADAEGKNKVADSAALVLGTVDHTPEAAWQYSESQHWHICSVCKEVPEGSKAEHLFAEGKCAACGYAAGDPIPDFSGEAPVAPGETVPEDVTLPTQEQPNASQPAVDTIGPLPATDAGSGGIGWWVFALVAVAAIGLGVGIALLVFKRKK